MQRKGFKSTDALSRQWGPFFVILENDACPSPFQFLRSSLQMAYLLLMVSLMICCVRTQITVSHEMVCEHEGACSMKLIVGADIRDAGPEWSVQFTVATDDDEPSNNIEMSMRKEGGMDRNQGQVVIMSPGFH